MRGFLIVTKIVTRQVDQLRYAWQPCDARMRDRWQQLFAAYFLPPLVGVGICFLFVQTLRLTEVFGPSANRLISMAINAQKSNLGSHQAAEVRVSVPLEKRYEPLPLKQPLLEEEQALEQAELDKSKVPAGTPTQSESSELAKSVVSKPKTEIKLNVLAR